MTLEDLEYIFKPQVDLGFPDVKLWFMLIDGDYKIIKRHPLNDLEGLLPMLDSFTYSGSLGCVPRFVK